MTRSIFLAAALALAGCSSGPARIIEIPTPLPCATAEYLPDQPDEIFDLDGKSDGETAQAYIANREEWIGSEKELRSRLKACK